MTQSDSACDCALCRAGWGEYHNAQQPRSVEIASAILASFPDDDPCDAIGGAAIFIAFALCCMGAPRAATLASARAIAADIERQINRNLDHAGR